MMATPKRLIAAAVLVLSGVGAVYGQVPAAEAERIRQRQQLALMEDVLASAIRNGSQNVIREIRRVAPDYNPRINPARISGFRLDGHGVVVFHVDVPQVPLPFLWDVRLLEIQTRNAVRAFQQLRNEALQMPDGPERTRLMNQANQLEQELTLGNFRVVQPARGVAAAASLAPVGVTGGPANPEPTVVEDPESAYTREVKTAMIDAMLTNSQGLGIKPDEWLTIVARAVPNNPQSPGDALDDSVQILKVKGSTLAAFQAQTISQDEARKLVEITEQ
jgi:hypothetical protein